VNWVDARDYAAWLTKRTGKPYRLLSEAEWEYAARAGSQTTYYWGDRADHNFANWGLDKGYGSGVAKGRDRWIYTSPVGSFPPNRFGLYDMSGNVLQFVEDCLGSYGSTPRDGSPFVQDTEVQLGSDFAELNGTRTCAYRIARGGDWGDPPEAFRSASRNFAPPPPDTLEGYRSGGVGFRVARDLPTSR
jgi:formylglycine-generating enzyme required for sulfatase activity